MTTTNFYWQSRESVTVSDVVKYLAVDAMNEWMNDEWMNEWISDKMLSYRRETALQGAL